MENYRGAAPRRDTPARTTHSSRERLLDVLTARDGAEIAELATATGLHVNTVRGHLLDLHADGRVRRERQAPHGRGRPATRWRAVDPIAADPYIGLATALADILATTAVDAAGAARAAGAAWGRRLAREHASGMNARELAVAIMREQGFAPDGEPQRVTLRRCPLLAAASRRPDIVCAVHQGMLDGIVGGTGATLEPFAADGGCILRLRGVA